MSLGLEAPERCNPTLPCVATFQGDHTTAGRKLDAAPEAVLRVAMDRPALLALPAVYQLGSLGMSPAASFPSTNATWVAGCNVNFIMGLLAFACLLVTFSLDPQLHLMHSRFRAPGHGADEISQARFCLFIRLPHPGVGFSRLPRPGDLA